MITNIIGFTERQIKPSDSNCKIIELLNLFDIHFNNNENKFLSLAYICSLQMMLLLRKMLLLRYSF